MKKCIKVKSTNAKCLKYPECFFVCLSLKKECQNGACFVFIRLLLPMVTLILCSLSCFFCGPGIDFVLVYLEFGNSLLNVDGGGLFSFRD